VKVGDTIAIDESIVLLESDKASVEVPSTSAGVVKSILVNQGDEVSEGAVLIELEAEDDANAVETQQADVSDKTSENTPTSLPDDEILQEVASHQPGTAAKQSQAPAANSVASATVEVKVPDIGVEKALVGEILVQVGDKVEKDQSIIVVESDKATVEVPSTTAGVIKSIHVELGQNVSEGIALITIEAAGQAAPATAPAPEAEVSAAKTVPIPAAVPKAETATAPETQNADKLTKEQNAANAKVYAGPAVRKLARELGVVLAEVKASGPHARLMKEDLFAYVKTRLTAPAPAAVAPAAAAPAGLPKLPSFDAFGGVEEKALTRLQQVSIPQLSLNNYIPQVTQFDLADITELEAWRNELKGNFKKEGLSLTIMSFIIKAVAHLLKEEREFAGHLSDDGKSVLLRNEIHMGIAVATPDGLTVPVLRNPDQKSIKQISKELGELGQKARDKKLSPKDLQGANFTISSLGAIGGTAFTPLVNWPQVAILGISPATMQPVWNGEGFDPRLMLPLSLSYDHRVINGADAARFTNKLTKLLKDIRSLLI